MEQTTSIPLFQLGEVVATEGALNKAEPVWMANCLARHMRGDWGCVCEEDVETNNADVREGGRLLSADPSTGVLGVSSISWQKQRRKIHENPTIFLPCRGLHWIVFFNSVYE